MSRRIRAFTAHVLGRTCRDTDCGPCSFRRAFTDMTKDPG